MEYKKLHLNEYYDFLSADGADPTLEIFLPYNMREMNRQDKKRPCILVLPGGGYAMCSEREAEPIALKFLPEGFNAFILTYSTAPHRFPTQLRQVAAAMELIYANAENWNCDTSKIAIIGFSAGGHLAAHYSTMYDCKEVREVFPQSKPVNASILGYPVITADSRYTHEGTFMNLLGHKPQTEEEFNYFSCERLVSDSTPPTFLWHTFADNAVPIMNSILYAKALAEHNIPTEMHIYPFGVHGLSTCDGETIDNLDANINHAKSWLTEVMTWLKITF